MDGGIGFAIPDAPKADGREKALKTVVDGDGSVVAISGISDFPIERFAELLRIDFFRNCSSIDINRHPLHVLDTRLVVAFHPMPKQIFVGSFDYERSNPVIISRHEVTRIAGLDANGFQEEAPRLTGSLDCVARVFGNLLAKRQKHLAAGQKSSGGFSRRAKLLARQPYASNHTDDEIGWADAALEMVGIAEKIVENVAKATMRYDHPGWAEQFVTALKGMTIEFRQTAPSLARPMQNMLHGLQDLYTARGQQELAAFVRAAREELVGPIQPHHVAAARTLDARWTPEAA